MGADLNNNFYLVLTLLDLKIGGSRKSESDDGSTIVDYTCIFVSNNLPKQLMRSIEIDEIYIDEQLVVSPSSPS